MVDYVKLQALALKLVTANGKTINVKKFGTTAADPSKPWRGPADNRNPYAAETDVQAVELGVSKIRIESMGLAINKKDIPDNVFSYWLIAVAPTTPDLQGYNELWDGTVSFKIELITRLKPAATTLLWVVGVSR